MTQATRNFLQLGFLLIFGGASLVCREAPAPAEKAELDEVIAQVYARFGIDTKAIRTSTVKDREGKVIRVVRRVTVTSDFNSLTFNHVLSTRLEGTGAVVAATEEPEKRSVTMHIKKDGVIVESLIVFMTKEP